MLGTRTGCIYRHPKIDLGVYAIDYKDSNKNSKCIEYRFELNLNSEEGGKDVTYVNLTREGVWVHRDHLRDTDIRFTVLSGDEVFTKEYPATPAEQMCMLLLGIKYELS